MIVFLVSLVSKATTYNSVSRYTMDSLVKDFLSLNFSVCSLFTQP